MPVSDEGRDAERRLHSLQIGQNHSTCRPQGPTGLPISRLRHGSDRGATGRSLSTLSVTSLVPSCFTRGNFSGRERAILATRSSLGQGAQKSFFEIFSRRRSSRARRFMLPIRSCVNSSVRARYESNGSTPSRRGESSPLLLEGVGESWFDLLIVPSDLDTAGCSQRFPSVSSANSPRSMFEGRPSAPPVRDPRLTIRARRRSGALPPPSRTVACRRASRRRAALCPLGRARARPQPRAAAG